MKSEYDVIVIGGGHAGVEAAHAASKMGAQVALITLNINMISNMPCNPSIGGSAKGIVVREVDALGGIMGLLADQERLQIKMLNTGKGPAVQCLRAQEDKKGYPNSVQNYLKNIKNLDIIEGMVTKILYFDKKITGVHLKDGQEFKTKAIVIATGTYLDSEIIRGSSKTSGGPDGEQPAIGLSDSLREMGINLYRLKTGTPPRVDKDSIDFSQTVPQYGQEGYLNFSYLHDDYVSLDGQLPCHLIYTNLNTHEIIRNNLDKSGQYNGLIRSLGPRYCPSIEAKIVNFSDKERHQLFLEPEYRNSNSIYIQGFSTSMEESVQTQMVHSLKGLENAKILKYGYAIEYDAVSSDEFDSSLKFKKYEGLYGAGQIMGTSGYEEAAGLGIMAGINAVLAINNKPPFILHRNESYIGVMIDDIITKGVDEPYRLLSSRAEYRLLLRHDNADTRLTKYGHELGLIDENRYEEFIKKEEKLASLRERMKKIYIGCSKKNNDYLSEHDLIPIASSISAYDFLKRPGVKYENVVALVDELRDETLTPSAIMQLEISVKFEGYIKKQEATANAYSKYDNKLLPNDIDYISMDGLALEARQKLNKVRPLTVGQASRISGVNPTDISILILELKKRNYD